MSLLGKMKFWRHDDLDLGLPQDDISAEAEATGLPDEFGLETPKNDILERTGNATTLDKLGLEDSNTNQNRNQLNSSFEKSNNVLNSSQKDFDLISSKLDTIKAELDSMNQRIQRIERIAQAEQKREEKKLW